MSRWLLLLVIAMAGAALLLWQIDSIDADRKGVATLALALYAAVLLQTRRRLRARAGGPAGEVDYLIAWASETGTARQLAGQTRKRLVREGFSAAITELNQLARAPLPKRGLLFVVSTTGNGDAPRGGTGWPEAAEPTRYQGLPFAVLALGDRSYPRFCAFGMDVASGMQQAGAEPMFEPVLVSQADPNLINYWYQRLTGRD